MKKKIAAVIAVLVVAVFASAFATSCKKEEVPDYSFSKAFLSDVGYEKAKVAKSAEWSVNSAVSEDMISLGRFSPFYFKEGENGLSAYNTITGKYVFENKSGVTDYQTLNISMLEVKYVNEGELHLAVYDSFGHLVFDEKFTSGTEPSFEQVDNFDITVAKDTEISYEMFEMVNQAGTVVYTFEVANGFLGNGKSYKLVSGIESPYAYSPTEVGGRLGQVGMVLSRTAGQKQKISMSENLAGDGVISVYDESDNLIAKTVIPSDLDYENELSNTTMLYSRTRAVSQGSSTYSYVTANGVPMLKDYFVADFMAGTVNRIDFSYEVEDVIASYSNKYENGVEYTDIQDVVLMVRRFENGMASEKVSYLRMNPDGSVMEDITDRVTEYGLDAEEIIQIAGDRYLMKNGEDSLIINDRLEKVADLNCKAERVDIPGGVIIGSIVKGGQRYYGSVDFDGKVVTEFKYTNLDNIELCSDSNIKSHIGNGRVDEEYLVDYSTGKSIRLGYENEGKENVRYIGTNGYNLYYENTVKSVTQDTETRYYLETKLYDLKNNLIATVKNGSYGTFSDARQAIENLPVELVKYIATSEGERIVFEVSDSTLKYAEEGWIYEPAKVLYNFVTDYVLYIFYI